MAEGSSSRSGLSREEKDRRRAAGEVHKTAGIKSRRQESKAHAAIEEEAKKLEEVLEGSDGEGGHRRHQKEAKSRHKQSERIMKEIQSGAPERELADEKALALKSAEESLEYAKQTNSPSLQSWQQDVDKARAEYEEAMKPIRKYIDVVAKANDLSAGHSVEAANSARLAATSSNRLESYIEYQEAQEEYQAKAKQAVWATHRARSLPADYDPNKRPAYKSSAPIAPKTAHHQMLDNLYAPFDSQAQYDADVDAVETNLPPHLPTGMPPISQPAAAAGNPAAENKSFRRRTLVQFSEDSSSGPPAHDPSLPCRPGKFPYLQPTTPVTSGHFYSEPSPKPKELQRTKKAIEFENTFASTQALARVTAEET